MKLIIQNNRIAATATDDYTGPDFFIEAPSDFDTSRVGDYTYIDGVLSLPEPVVDTRITKLAFRNRFTKSEKAIIELAAADTPIAPMADRMKAAAVRSYLADVQAAEHIDLSREDLQEGVLELETHQLIGEGRASQVMSLEIAEHERVAR